MNFLNDSKKLTYTAEVDGSKMGMSYIVYAPDDYENMDALPLILFLHGGDEIWETGTSATVILQKLIDNGRFPCILVAPKCISDCNWCDWQMATLALGIISEVKNTYNCDSKRFYIIGYEMGAYAVYDFIGHEANNNGIAAAVSIGGAYMHDLIENIKKVPLWIFYGDSDYNVEEYSKKMIEELEKAGGNYKSTDYTGIDNIFSFICDETDLFEWIFLQRK